MDGDKGYLGSLAAIWTLTCSRFRTLQLCTAQRGWSPYQSTIGSTEFDAMHWMVACGEWAIASLTHH
jgi:hypothetical protein